MRCGIIVPNFGEYGDPITLLALATEAEQAGWDGFFLWDHIQFFDPGRPVPVVDPCITLAAIATATEHIRLGPLVTPLARRRPWKLARETASLDRLSGGRLILGVGLGGSIEADFEWFGEITDPRLRAQMLDEGLEILTGLWSGEPFSFSGKHYQIRETVFAPTPVQVPRIPIWVAGTWPHHAPMLRAVRWDGIFPLKATAMGPMPLTPAELAEILTFINPLLQHKPGFDVVTMGESPSDDPARAHKVAEPFITLGLTWWWKRCTDSAARWTRCASAFERVRQHRNGATPYSNSTGTLSPS